MRKLAIAATVLLALNLTGAKASEIQPHPAGCPGRLFCGCGTSLYLLGKAVAAGGLAVAANWLGFPKSSCAPRMAAARRGHVFAIISCLPGNKALAYDPNSGGRKTRIHVRSLNGYTVVNPHSGEPAPVQYAGKKKSYRIAKYKKKRTRYAHAKRHHGGESKPVIVSASHSAS